MFTRKYRRRRYGKLLDKYGLDNQTPYMTFKHLVYIWRRIRWNDYNDLDVDILLSNSVSTITSTLPELVEGLEAVNAMIASERDGRIEQENNNRGSRKTRTLDAFLSDDQQQPIIVGDYLRKMAGQLQLLDVTIENDYQELKSDYYARICDYLISDVINITEVIIRKGGVQP